QARGDITDDKADIYSVGVVMYEMLTGQVPFQSENSVSVAIMQLQTEPKRPRDINGTIPIGLEQIVLRAMQKNTHDRYQSAAEMLLDLEEFKRNPAVKFEYNHFVDNVPTKFIGKQAVQNHLPINEVHEDNENEQEEKSRLVPILIGVAGGLLALVAIILITFGISNSLGRDKNKVKVIDFVGMNYESEIKENSNYIGNYIFDTVEVQNTEYSEGEVCKQNQAPGDLIDKPVKILLDIAMKTIKKPIPNVINLAFAEAKKTLENLGFVVSEVSVPDTSVDYGTVLRTSPEQGTQAAQGSTVIVYYASDENLVVVPKLIGWDVEAAKRLLTSLELVLDENISQEDSIKPKGEIIKQSFDEKIKVSIGTKIAITISTGIPPESTANISVKLPRLSSGETGKIMATINSDIVLEKSVLLDGSEYSFDVVGSGKDKKLKVFADTTLLYECVIDFTTTPVTISQEKIYADTSTAIIPVVTGFTEFDAKAALDSVGFTNITVEEEVVSDPGMVGIVISQDPSGFGLSFEKPLDTAIILRIGVFELVTGT
ncbi:MAG: PASTA domain-containing protein, partial [Eubacteriales bacterium]